jgi:hypothetical protein
MSARSELSKLKFVWTPRRVAVKFIISASNQPFDPTLLPALLSRLDKEIDRQLGPDEASRAHARKEALRLIALYPTALSSLSEVMCECLQLVSFTSAFLGRKQIRCAELLERLVAGDNQLSVRTLAMELIREKHFRVQVMPSELWNAICATQSILLDSCDELRDGPRENIGLLDRPTCIREAQLEVCAFESSAREKADIMDPAGAAWFIRNKTHAVLARFADLKFVVGVLNHHWQNETSAMEREFRNLRRPRRPSESKSQTQSTNQK